MMFKKEMADLILAGKKTETRRLPRKTIYKVGSIQPVQTSYRTKAVARIKILSNNLQRLCDMMDENVYAEGFEDWSEFMGYLDEVNKTHMKPHYVVRVYKFEVVT